MSTINPTELNVESLLTHTAGASRRRSSTSSRENDAGESLVERIQAATSEIEQQITAGALDPGAALNLMAARACTLLAASGVAIGLVDGNEVICRATAGMAPDAGARIKVEEGLSGECIRSSRIVHSRDTAQDARVDRAACQALNLRSAVLVPIRSAGIVIGVLEVFSAEPDAFDDWAVLAMSQVARFISGVTNARLEPLQMEAVSAAAPAPAVSLSAASVESSERLRPLSSRPWRIALLIVAALITLLAASYRVREMIRSARTAHSRTEADVPGILLPSAGETAAPTVPMSSEPAIAKEDGQLPATTFDALKPSWRRSNTPSRSPGQTARMVSSEPLPQVIQHAGGSPRKLEVPPDPPALAVVEPASQRDNVIGPLMKVPVTDPKLAAAQATPPEEARARRPRFMSRVLGKPKKLKVLLEKDPKKNGDKPKANAQPQVPLPEN